jgi:hypothetical protein
MINGNANPTRSENERIKMNKIAGQVSVNFSKKMKEKFDFDLLGMGGGGFHDLNTLSFHFNCPMILDVFEARKLIIQVVDEFINDINSKQNIKLYLRNYPFTVNNINLLIGFKKNNQYPIEGKVAFISCSNEKIDYATFEHEKNHLTNIFRETYNEALQIISKKNNDNTSNSSSINPDLPSS